MVFYCGENELIDQLDEAGHRDDLKMTRFKVITL